MKLPLNPSDIRRQTARVTKIPLNPDLSAPMNPGLAARPARCDADCARTDHGLRRRQGWVSREILSRSPEETHRLGVRLARNLRVPGVLLLRGMLGTGKTTLARGVAEGLGLADLSLVCSPSYALVNIYYGRCPIYHVDLYRVSGEKELRSVGIEDFLESEGVTIVEWSERLPMPPKSAIEVKIEDAGGDARLIRICYPAVPESRRRARAQNSRRSALRRSRAFKRLERGIRKK